MNVEVPWGTGDFLTGWRSVSYPHRAGCLIGWLVGSLVLWLVGRRLGGERGRKTDCSRRNILLLYIGCTNAVNIIAWQYVYVTSVIADSGSWRFSHHSLWRCSVAVLSGKSAGVSEEPAASIIRADVDPDLGGFRPYCNGLFFWRFGMTYYLHFEVRISHSDSENGGSKFSKC